MLSDDEIDKLIIHEYGPNADIDWHFCFARAVERAAYERAASLCDKADKSAHPSDLADAIRAFGEAA